MDEAGAPGMSGTLGEQTLASGIPESGPDCSFQVHWEAQDTSSLVLLSVPVLQLSLGLPRTTPRLPPTPPRAVPSRLLAALRKGGHEGHPSPSFQVAGREADTQSDALCGETV